MTRRQRLVLAWSPLPALILVRSLVNLRPVKDAYVVPLTVVSALGGVLAILFLIRERRRQLTAHPYTPERWRLFRGLYTVLILAALVCALGLALHMTGAWVQVPATIAFITFFVAEFVRAGAAEPEDRTRDSSG